MAKSPTRTSRSRACSTPSTGNRPPDKTVTAVLSDHGESLGEHGEHTHGVFLYDSTLRIPFIMAGPGIPAGLRVKQQARTIDFLPTLLEVMGGRAPGYVQGLSLVPAFSGKSVATDISYAETLYPKMNMNWSELRAIRTNRWKYIRAPRPELYDLTSDPGETSNVIQQHGPEVQNFEAQLKNMHFVRQARGTRRWRPRCWTSASWTSSSRSATCRARVAVPMS